MLVNLNPFNLSGPQFLIMYSISLGIVSATTIAWRILRRISHAESGGSQGKPLDIWELAYLRGRDLAVAQTAVVDLSTAKLIETDKKKTRLIATSLEPHKQLSPVPFTIFRAAQIAGGLSAVKLQKEVQFECERIRDRLIDRGFIKSWSDRLGEVWVGYVGFGSLMAFGCVRLGLGIFRDKPVGYLALLLLLTGVIGLALTYTRFLTSKGRQALLDSIAELECQRAKRPRLADFEPERAASGEQVPALATWAFAVMGLATAQSLIDPEISELIKKHAVVDATSSSDCSANGCGGDGGGSGCGGGGCGGGGCGGCGS